MELFESSFVSYDVLKAELFAQRHSLTCDKILSFKSNIVTQSNIKLTHKTIRIHFN